MKRISACILIFVLIMSMSTPLYADGGAPMAETGNQNTMDVNAESAVLMDFNTGSILYAKNENTALPPASVTKIMTLLLIMEAVKSGKLSYDTEISVSESAASMGGSQVFLEAGERMRVDELIKCVVVASANDAALALAEAIAGSEGAFVSLMNKRAEELGMKSTRFENVTGLDDDTKEHLTSALDIALMSRELMKHEKIFEYSTLWMDSIRNGSFGLTNTNRLIRFYNGATGLKTGSTSKAGFCISATAERDGLHLIAVIMGSPTRDERNNAAKTLLDYGFANYSLYSGHSGSVGEIAVVGGDRDSIEGKYVDSEFLVPKGEEKNITVEYIYDTKITAPVKENETIGKVKYSLDGKVICENDLISDRSVGEITFKKQLIRLIGGFLLK